MVRATYIKIGVLLLAVALLAAVFWPRGDARGEDSAAKAVQVYLEAAAEGDVDEVYRVSNYDTKDGIEAEIAKAREGILKGRDVTKFEIKELETERMGSGHVVQVSYDGVEVQRFDVTSNHEGICQVLLKEFPTDTSTPTSDPN